jgi:threonine/homoserine/homoserine lactone efflux protein
MTFWSALASFAVVAGLLTVTPGLDTALVLRSSLRDGRRAALLTALGVNAGVLVWGVAAAVGVSALLAASATAFLVVRLVGAVYLVWLGVRMLSSAWRGQTHADATSEAPSHTLAASFRRGLLTNLLNPKVGAFYVALLPQFMVQGVPPALMGVLLAGVHNIEGLVWFGVLILGSHSARRLLQAPAARRVVDAITGSVLLGFGAKLALDAH